MDVGGSNTRSLSWKISLLPSQRCQSCAHNNHKSNNNSNMPFFKNTGKALADVIPGLGKFTFDPTLGTIFVTSGTGVIGFRVAAQLLEAGHKDVRVGIWRGDRQMGPTSDFADECAKELEEKGATVVDFDWNNPADYQTALDQVKTVFCTIPHMKNWQTVFPAFLQAAKDHKIEHFVKISFLRKGDVAERYRSHVPFVQFHGTCDDILEKAKSDSRISYTILCTSHLMSTPLLHQGSQLKEEKKFVTASYGMGVNYVSPNDVADAATAVLLNLKPHRNQVYNLSGPGPIKDSDVAKLLKEYYKEPIEHVQLGYHEYKADVQQRGLPKWFVQDSAEFERMKASGIDEERASYSDSLQALIGRKPETFQHYLLDDNRRMRPGKTFP